MNPTLFIFSGLPASGKSTLAKFLAKEYHAVFLRIDTIEQALKDLCNIDVQGEGYELSYKIAEDNLKIGNHVVADSCNPIALTRQAWEDVAKKNDSLFINIEIKCSDKEEHKKRVETRNCEIKGLKLPTWQEIENREYHPWENGRIVIDTANKSAGESCKELKEKIKQYLEIKGKDYTFMK